MIRFLFALLALLNISAASFAATTPEEAEQLARDGKFNEAVDAYEAVLASGYENADVYYNLGYAYFKTGALGKAILNFERSRRLNPSDPDVLANLDLAYSLTDKMQTVEPFVLDKWWQGVKDSFGSDGWAVLFVTLFFLALCGIGCFLFLDSVAARKIGFFSALLLAIAAVFALSVSLQKRSEILNSDEAIIMSSSVTLQTSPDKNGSQMAVLHEGTYVKIIDTLGEWIEVRLKDGNIGWLKANEVEKI